MYERVGARTALNPTLAPTRVPSPLLATWASRADERSVKVPHQAEAFHFGRVSVLPPDRSIGGDMSAEDEDIDLAGDGEADSDSETQATTSASSELAGDATTISTTDLSAAVWSPNGKFKWWITWVTDGVKGWIVQKITNTYSGTDGAGKPITTASVGTAPSYYEAWEVDAAGGITGSLGTTPNRDRWERSDKGVNSKGKWSTTGDVSWTAKDPAKSGFTSGGVANAGSLLSSKKAPKSLSKVLLNRTADGTWDSTGAAPTHTGSAK